MRRAKAAPPAVAILVIWWIYANKKPAFYGRVVGILGFYGLSPEGFFRAFRGMFVDVKDILTYEALKMFKEDALQSINEELSKELPENHRKRLTKLRDTLASLSEDELLKKIQVYGTRRDFVRHLFIVLGAERPIEDYAIPSKYVTFDWAFLSFIRRLVIWGVRWDLPGTYIVKPYGKCKVHIFMPIFDPKSEDFKARISMFNHDQLESLALIG